MDYKALLILVVISAFIHVVEEYKFGWVEWANGFFSEITVKQFMVINVLFIVLCVIAALIGKKHIVFSSSVFSLLLLNALVHIAPTIKQRTFSPGMVSAVFLFVPIGIMGYVNILSNNLLTIYQFMISILLGVLWMSVPFIYQVVRISTKNRNE